MKIGLKIVVAALVVCALAGCSKSDSPEKEKPNSIITSMRFENETYVPTSDGAVQPRIFVTFENSSEPVAYDNVLNSHGVVWSPSDPTLIKVSEQGVVSFLKYGVSTLTARTAQFATPITTLVGWFDPSKGLWCGQWGMNTWNGDSILADKVYIVFESDDTFDLYQNIDSQGYAHFTGTFTVTTKDGVSVLSGVYSDGVAWGHTYDLVTDGFKLLTTSQSDRVVASYKPTTIPAYVKDGVSAQASRVASGKRFL